MGKKVNPFAYRLSANKRNDVQCCSTWYADKDHYKTYLADDFAVRDYIHKHYARAGINKIEIERPAQNAHVIVHCTRPGIIIGKKGGDSSELKAKISQVLACNAHVSIKEVKKVDLSATLVAMNICQQLEKRAQFRKVMKRAVQSTMRSGALGIKICVSGRIGGAEIARSEWCKEGRVPLHTLRANIDYGVYEAYTTYGIIGVKVWIYLGDIDSKLN